MHDNLATYAAAVYRADPVRRAMREAAPRIGQAPAGKAGAA